MYPAVVERDRSRGILTINRLRGKGLEPEHVLCRRVEGKHDNI